jgi:hypothetical protein
MRSLSNQTHYENASKDFKTSEEQILDDETVAKLREKFTMTNLDKRVEDAFPIINKVMAELENAPKEEEQVNELEPDAEPIDAPIEPPVDHAPIVQSFLTDPEQKLVLTKFKDKNTMLSSILSDIASRLLTKSGEEDRVANFASRVADEMEQEKSATFKPTPNYMKNKKIAIQLAKRYIDDYKKMQSDPDYEKEVRMEPGEFSPKKDLKGKAKETEAFENWVANVGEATIKPYVSMYKGDDGKMVYDVLDKDSKSAFKSGDYKAAEKYLHANFDKLKEFSQEETPNEEIELDELAKTEFESWLEKNYKKSVRDLKADEYADMVRKFKMSKEREGQMQKAGILKQEGNAFAQAVQKAKAAGMKKGDKFKVGDKEYTLQDAIELAGMQLEDFYSEEELAYDSQIDRIKNLASYTI